MATALYHLGRWAFRRRRLVTATWLAVLGAVVAAAIALAGPTSAAFTIPGTPSQRAIDLLGDRFPEAAAGNATARVVVAAPDGQTLSAPDHRAAIDRLVRDLGRAPQVATVGDPFRAGTVNPPSTVGFAQVTYRVPAMDVTEEARRALTAAADPARAAGLTVEVGGDALAPQPETGAGEVLGVVVAAVVLVLTFGSLIAAGLPLLTALVGIGIGVGGIVAASGPLDLSGNTTTLALMLGLAVAIDYALLIVSRHRHELDAGHEPREAAARAVGTAGSAIVFAGLTVVIALAALAVVGVPFLTQMGVAAALTVVVAVLIALTLLPALLGFAGGRVRGGRLRRRHAGPARRPAGRRWAELVTRRPAAVLLVAVLGLAAVALPAQDLRLGMPDDSNAAPDSTQRKAYDLLAAGFGAGFNGPLALVVDTTGSVDRAGAVRQVSERVAGLPHVATVTPPLTNAAGDTAVLTVVPTTGPSTPEVEQLVRDIRGQETALRTASGASIGVTGLTAVNIDISEKLRGALLPYLAVVVGLAVVLLTLVFRSLLVPLTATLGFLLSVAATFGAVVAVFQWGWLAGLLGVDHTGPVISFLPIVLIGIVFGLAMDYQVFLVTRMREEYVRGRAPREAVVTGFAHGARVVTAAAIIMISVFAGFVLSPESFVKSVGFALGIAVLFDALVVRMTIVPAVMALLGRAAWWLPGWLARSLPDVDVEGERLRHRLATSRPAAPQPTSH